MSFLRTLLAPVASPLPDPTGDALLDLARYGTPNVRYSEIGEGWVARCDLRTTAAGLASDVHSERGHATPFGAVAECLQRVRAVVGGAA